MKITKLIKRAATNPNFTEVNNNSNPNIYQANKKIKNENNFKNLINNIFVATTEFYKISSGNHQEMFKLISILENENNNNNNNQNMYDQNYYNENYNNNKQKNDILNNLKLIVSINNKNLYNYYYDSKIILKKIEIDRRSQNQRIMKSMSNKHRPLIINNNNKTIDNLDQNHNKYSNMNFSPINSFIVTKKYNNNKTIIKENLPIKTLFTNLIKFKDIIGEHSPKMKNIFMKINNDLYNEFKKLEKEKQKHKINSGIQNARITPNNKSSVRGNSFSKTFTNFYDTYNREGDKRLMEKLNIYKIKNENYEFKIDELECQLEDLKSYSNALEKTLQDKNDSNNNIQTNEQNMNKLQNVIKNNKNLIKSIEELDEINKKLTEENNKIKVILKKKDYIIKQLNLNNNKLKIKIKNYENIITQNEVDNLNKNNNNVNLYSYNNDNNNNCFKDELKIIQNDYFSYEINSIDLKMDIEILKGTINQKDNEIFSLKKEILKNNDNINNKISEYEKTNNNYKLLLNEKSKQINIQEKEIKDLKNQITNLKTQITNNKNKNKKSKNIIISEIKIEIIGIKQDNLKKDEYKIKYEQKDRELNTLKKEYINQINLLNSTILNNNQIIENKDQVINELKLNNQINDNNIYDLKQKELEKETNKLKKDNEKLLKANSELNGIRESIHIKEQENKDIIRELKQDKLLLENELDEFKKKNEQLNKEIIESKNVFDNISIKGSNNINIKESYSKKVSKSHTDFIKKIKNLEDDIENKNQELEGLRNFIQKLQKEKENIVLNNNYNNNNIINSNENEIKLKKEIERLKGQLEHLSSTFPKEMEELRNENEKLLNKYNNLKRDKNNTAG